MDSSVKEKFSSEEKPSKQPCLSKKTDQVPNTQSRFGAYESDTRLRRCTRHKIVASEITGFSASAVVECVQKPDSVQSGQENELGAGRDSSLIGIRVAYSGRFFHTTK